MDYSRRCNSSEGRFCLTLNVFHGGIFKSSVQFESGVKISMGFSVSYEYLSVVRTVQGYWNAM